MINYFELYQLPVGFHPDVTLVKSKYYKLSRLYHPDRHTHASADQQAEVLKMAALNNDAYKVLSSEDAVMAYILRQNQLLEEEEKYNLPQDFLMEMMDLNDAISEFELDQDNASLQSTALKSLEDQLSQWAKDAGQLTSRFDAGEHTEALLLKIKDYYFRKKYLLRIQERMNKFAARQNK